MRNVMARFDLDAKGLTYAAAAALVISYVATLGMWFAQHVWLLDAHGQPIFTDFVAIWTSGRLALHGAALSAYNGWALHAAEAKAIGHNFEGFLGWPYPPMFFFVAAILGSMPFVPALLCWGFATLASYAATVCTVARSRGAILLACAAPWAAVDLKIGQNGFLTATLFGAALLNIEKRPVLAGVLLGLLTYKPQFGILIPFALVADARWRVIFSACVTTAILLILSGAMFGFETFAAFFHELPRTTQTLLVEGSVGWNKLQSIYGLTRWMGGDDVFARILQGGVSMACLTGVCLIWRSRTTFPLKAVVLICATFLATPYLFFYDLPALAVAMAFLHRDRTFDSVEFTGIACAMAWVFAAAIFNAPLAPLCVICVLAIAARRTLRTANPFAHVALQRG
jgi:hypothetical protein